MTTLTPRATERFLEQLPWYVNGTLPEDERAEVEALIAASPECRRQYEAMATLAAQLRKAQARPFDEQASLDRILAGVRRDDPRVPVRRAAFASRWRVPLAFAAGMALAAPATWFAWDAMDDNDPAATAGTLAPMATRDAAILLVRFKPEAAEGEIRRVLGTLDADVVGGPGGAGHYTLRVPPGRAVEAQRALEASGLVDTVAAPLAPPR